MAPLAASPASFQPSKAATSTGSRSRARRRRVLDQRPRSSAGGWSRRLAAYRIGSPGKPTTRAGWRGTVGLVGMPSDADLRTAATARCVRTSALSSATVRWAPCCRPPTSRWTTSPGWRAATRSSTSPARTSLRDDAPGVLRGRCGRRRDQHVRRNLPNLAEYDIADRIRELAEAGTRLAREVADEMSPAATARRFVLGSVGPGTKLPTLGHAPFAVLRDAYAQAARACSTAASTPSSSRPARTCCRPRRPSSAASGRWRRGPRLPIIAHVTVETTGTMLLGTEIGAALTALEPLGIDLIGLNCATGPAEMSEHLRHLSKHARVPVSVMPNAGLPQLGPNGADYPLTARGAGRGARRVRPRVRTRPGRRLLRHHPRAHPPGGRGGPSGRPDAGAARRCRAGRVVAVPGGAVRSRTPAC